MPTLGIMVYIQQNTCSNGIMHNFVAIIITARTHVRGKGTVTDAGALDCDENQQD